MKVFINGELATKEYRWIFIYALALIAEDARMLALILARFHIEPEGQLFLTAVWCWSFFFDFPLSAVEILGTEYQRVSREVERWLFRSMYTWRLKRQVIDEVKKHVKDYRNADLQWLPSPRQAAEESRQA